MENAKWQLNKTITCALAYIPHKIRRRVFTCYACVCAALSLSRPISVNVFCVSPMVSAFLVTVELLYFKIEYLHKHPFSIAQISTYVKRFPFQKKEEERERGKSVLPKKEKKS